MPDAEPLTQSQREQILQDLTGMQERANEISQLLGTCFGESSQLAIRAFELKAAVQRLSWELQRAPGFHGQSDGHGR